MLFGANMEEAQRANFEEDENNDHEHKKLCLIVSFVNEQAEEAYQKKYFEYGEEKIF